jgi:Holliday junction DNA helicase RuvA
MIGKIFGTICDVGTNFLIVNVNGVGYIVYCSGKIIKNSHVDDIVSLVTQTIVKENDISIYGFIDNSEKEFFNHLLGIQGVGAKLAQTILSTYSINDIIMSVQNNDDLQLIKVSGVGSKLAVRLVSELKNKKFISKMQFVSIVKNKLSDEDNSKIADVKSALVNLGYAEKDVLLVLQQLSQEQIKMNLATLIKLVLRELSK